MSYSTTNRRVAVTRLRIALVLAVVALFATAKATLQEAIGEPDTIGGKPDIIDGEPAPRGAYPFMVGLVGNYAEQDQDQPIYSHVCGGTLIDADWVLTAAHCVDTGEGPAPFPPEKLMANVGNINRTDWTGLISVEWGTMHPDYDRTTHNNDLALLKLSDTPSSNPVALVTEKLDVSTPVMLLGWGLNASFTFPHCLQQLRTETVGERFCNTTNNFNPDTEVCVGPVDGSGSACNGDSGGPMLVKDGEKWKLAGVTSRLSTSSSTWCSSHNATIYTSVLAHQEWIKDTIRDHDNSRLKQQL